MKKTILLLAMAISLICLADQPNGLLPISKVAGLTPVLNGKAPINSPTFTGIVGGITPAMVGLGSVNNTSDANKPISTAVQNVLNLYTTTTVADSRYNLVANNVNPYNYVYKKLQVDSISALSPRLTVAANFTNAIHTTSGDITSDNGAIAALGSNTATSYVQSYSDFKAASSTMNVKVGGNQMMKIINGTVFSDATPAVKLGIGDATRLSANIFGYSGSLSYLTLNSAQTLITPTYPDGNLTKPLTGSIFEVGNGTSHLFDIFSSIINTTVPITSSNLVDGYTTTVTAAGTTTLTQASNYQQYFTGTTTQTVVLPVVTTLSNGFQYLIVNNSTGTVTVNTSGANALVTLVGGTSAVVTCIDITAGTGTASWSVAYSGLNVAVGKKATINNTITLSGTDASTYTLPASTKTLAANDGSNWTFASQAIGDLHYATSTTAYGRLADVAVGQSLGSGGVGAAPVWNYKQPMNATPTILTAAATITWTPVVGTNIYTLTPTSATTINMGTIPAACVGSEIMLLVTTSGTSAYVITFGTNIKSQGTLTTSATTAMNHCLQFLVLSTTSVLELGARPLAE